MAIRRLGAEAFQTFQIVEPKQTHAVPATCEEVECEQYLRGWKMKIDLGTPLGHEQARYIKYTSGRSYTYEATPEGLVEFTFRSGQPCFQEHHRSIGRPPIFRVKGGDARGNPLRVPTRVHKKPEFWVEEFATHQEGLAEIQRRGSYEDV